MANSLDFAGYTAFAVCVDRLTKSTTLVTCKKKAIVMEYAWIFVDDVLD